MRRICFEKLLDLIYGLEVRGGRLIIRQFHTCSGDFFVSLHSCLFARPVAGTLCRHIVEFPVVRPNSPSQQPSTLASQPPPLPAA